ncbi:MAG: ATP synthase F1 subunit epsilon [Vulcanimicrobiota bacterium]
MRGGETLAGNTFYCEVITPERIKFKGEVSYLKVQGFEGEMGILKNHTPMIALLRPGEMCARYDDKEEYITLGDGFIKVKDNSVLIVVSSALRPDEMAGEEARILAEEEERYREEHRRVFGESDHQLILYPESPHLRPRKDKITHKHKPIKK